MKKFVVLILLFITGILFVSCGNSSEPEVGKEEAAHKEVHENPNMATLTNEQMKSIGVQLGQIEEKQLTASLKANGVLQVPNQNKASINTVYSGVVKSLLIQPGNTVSKGQTIATIANPDFLR